MAPTASARQHSKGSTALPGICAPASVALCGCDSRRRSSSNRTRASPAPRASKTCSRNSRMLPQLVRMPRTIATADGVLLVDKPAGMTSHDVVALARRSLGTRRVGHTGTLDPFATGLLIVLVGQATRLAQFVEDEPKVYDATITFGAETDTDDVTGQVVRAAAAPAAADVHAAIRALTGRIVQQPPAYSAKKVEGRRAYAAARAGSPLMLEPA